MAKRIHIPQEAGETLIVFGIASDEPIWKLCWEINSVLGLSLSARSGADTATDHPATHEQDTPQLFEQSGTAQPAALYEDPDSFAPAEIFLMPTPPEQLSRNIRPFRYLLALRSPGAYAGNVLPLLARLPALDFVKSAVDLSHIKSLTALIP